MRFGVDALCPCEYSTVMSRYSPDAAALSNSLFGSGHDVGRCECGRRFYRDHSGREDGAVICPKCLDEIEAEEAQDALTECEHAIVARTVVDLLTTGIALPLGALALI